MQSRIYNEQYGTDFRCFVPTNLYGKYDVYGGTSHVVAGLIEKASTCVSPPRPLPVWGTGSPLRQFCYAPDLANLILFTLFEPGVPKVLALVPREEYSIAQLAETVAKVYGVVKGCEYDHTKADGQYRKTMSDQALRELVGEEFKFTSLEDGLRETIEHYKKNVAKL